MSTPMARADEGGASFWIPGSIASFAAVPGDPGFGLDIDFYFYSGGASTGTTFLRGNRLVGGLSTSEPTLYLTPGYTFAQPVLNGQLSLSAGFTVADVATWAWGFVADNGTYDNAVGLGDLAPLASLAWQLGRHNVMTYITANVPIGSYNPNRLSNIGLGHWAIDAGAAYSYVSPAGLEFSVTMGVTENFTNPSTQYRTGIDGHLDAGMSYALSKAFYVGAVGYLYDQLTPDSGPGATLGAFEARVAALGPQADYSFSFGKVDVDLNLRAYKEFAAMNRLEGWNLWFTVSLSRARQRGSK